MSFSDKKEELQIFIICPRRYFYTMKDKGMKLKGIRTNRRTGKETEVELTYEIREGKYGPVFQLHGGPTGYESFYIEEGTLEAMSERGWCACMGGGGWDKLEISAEEMKKVYDAQVVAKGGGT